ncbi:MAG: tetratricopeptide repeat protein [Pseudobdellovibrionaceae bacterium]
MFNVLNFKHLLFPFFLAFVSFWYSHAAQSQTSGQHNDDIEIFDIDQELNSKTRPPEAKPTKPTAIPAQQPSLIQSQNSKKADSSISNDEKIERLKKEFRDNPKNTELIIPLAEEFTKKHDYEKATQLLWKYVDKIDRRGLILLAKAHENRKEPNEMIRALNILLGKDSKDYEAYSLMGNANALLKKHKDAVEAYKKAIELNSKYEPAYNGLVSIYEKRTPPNLYELRILYQDMIETFGRLPRFLRKLCEINTLDGTSEPAIQTCKEAINKEPNVADPYVHLAINYKAIGEDGASLKTLKQASKEFPKSELAQYQYAKRLEDDKNYIEAMNFYKAATEAETSSARSWLGLATSSFELKKFELALIAYKNACKYDKKNAVAFRKATTILRNQKNTEWKDKYESASESCTF